MRIIAMSFVAVGGIGHTRSHLPRFLAVCCCHVGVHGSTQRATQPTVVLR